LTRATKTISRVAGAIGIGNKRGGTVGRVKVSGSAVLECKSADGCVVNPGAVRSKRLMAVSRVVEACAVFVEGRSAGGCVSEAGGVSKKGGVTDGGIYA
jgi:hypothetical protein